MGVPGVTLPPDPIRAQPDFASAKTAFESAAAGPDPVRQRRGRPAGPPGPRASSARSRACRFPAPRRAPGSSTRAATLLNKPPKSGGSNTFVWDKESRPADNFAGTNTGGGDLWTANPSFDWQQPPAGKAASYVTPPLGADTTVIGAGALHAWIRASVPDVDLQVTVSEVRPDGKETYVQSGWLRASMRKLDKRAEQPARAHPEPAPR